MKKEANKKSKTKEANKASTEVSEIKKVATEGINKRLRDRRLELDYSVLEACIRLDISKRKLYLIENGYIKVDPKLQAKFIRKYKLDKDFFKDDFKGYPTPLDPPVVKTDDNSKFSRAFRSWQFRFISLAFMGGFIAMGSIGLNRGMNLNNIVPTFYGESVNKMREFTKSDESRKHSSLESTTSSFVGDDFYSLNYTFTAPVGDEFISAGVNFFNHDEYLAYTFTSSIALVETKSILGFDFGTRYFTFEGRYCNNVPRIHFNMYDKTDPLLTTSLAHISADIKKVKSGDVEYYETKYNLVEERDGLIMVPLTNESFGYYIYTSLFEDRFEGYFSAVNLMFEQYYPTTGVHYMDFDADLFNGIKNYDKESGMDAALGVWGVVGAVIFLAMFTLSIIKVFKWGLKISGETSKNATKVQVKPNMELKVKQKEKEITPREVPRNTWPTPILPEMVVRIFVLVVTFISSIGLFYIFQGLLALDVTTAISGFALKSEISSLSLIALMLFFFVKLDIRQNKKNTFTINFILFFAGVILYVFILMIQMSMLSSNVMKDYVVILDYLPGNIIWGILAFNLLSSALFSTPNFNKPTRKKYVAYRSLAIIPIAYIVISALYSIGKKAWGWTLPLPVSSLLFSKAFLLAVFSILYCVFVYMYKRHTEKVYGVEGAKIYQTGNRYFFTKNLVVAVIIALLGILDVILGKCAPNNPLGMGNNVFLFATIPFILLYHPHMGARNKKWDISFIALYGFAMVLGYILIVSNLSNYLASL